MKRKRRPQPKPQRAIPDAAWLRLVETLIAKHSTAPHKRGKYKGHAETDALAWVRDLAHICLVYNKRRSRGRPYDGNMALAALLGRVLVLWYCNVHRAKGFDPNRPLARRAVFTQIARYRGRLVAAMADDRLMGAVWGQRQQWSFPFGRGARGGKFV